MAINKVIDRNNNVLIDLTNDTVKPTNVLSGTKFHGADGKEYLGVLQPNKLDMLKYNFIDYDGTLLYSFTDEEIDAMEELPAGPDHTEDNLTFQEWNWSLEGLKNWDRSKCAFRPLVGANLITTDRKTYITIWVRAGRQFAIRGQNVKIDIDWGDGTVDKDKTSNVSHTYSTTGEYEIAVEIKQHTSSHSDGGIIVSSNTDAYCVTKMKLGDFGWSSDILQYTNVEYVNMPKFEAKYFATSTTQPYIGCNFAYNAKRIKTLVIPRNAFLNAKSNYSSSVSNASLRDTWSLETVSFGENIGCDKDIEWNRLYSLDNFLPILTFDTTSKSLLLSIQDSEVINADFSAIKVTNPEYPFKIRVYSHSTRSVIIPDNAELSSTAFYMCHSLNNVSLPDTLREIPGSAFYSCSTLRYLSIPDSVTSIASGAFSSVDNMTLDLSRQTKVIPASGSLGLGTNSKYLGRILVPAGLLDQYKSASYWSQHASIMEGV